MSAQIVIALYRPNAGKDGELRKLIEQHLPALREFGLATDRPSMLMRGEDGTYIEIFEWTSEDAATRAHEHPVIAKIWEGMAIIGSMPTLASLSEAQRPFPHFEPIAL